MKYIKLILTITISTVAFMACEDFDDPTEKLETQSLFVQFGAGIPDSTTVSEGDVLADFTALQAPISFETDLTAILSLSGDGTSLSDFVISGNDVISQTTSQAEVIIPFIPAGGEDLITDQTFLTFEFPSDGIEDGTKYVTVVLEGATGPGGIDLLGGRGNLRKQTVFEILDVD